MDKITSVSNAQVRRVIAYGTKAKARREDCVFVVEGWKGVMEAPPGDIAGLYVSESAASDPRFKALCASLSGKGAQRAVIVSDPVFARMSDTKTPQGVLAVVRQPVYTFGEVTGGERPLLLMLEDMQDPGNLGTVIRCAEAAGVTGIVMSRGCADVFSPKVVRSTMGAIYRVPFVYTDDAPGAVRKLRENGCTVFAADMDGEEVYDEASFTGPTIFLIGNEGNGLSEGLRHEANACVRIPMEGRAESLNAAVSAALLVFEAASQRRRSG